MSLKPGDIFAVRGRWSNYTRDRLSVIMYESLIVMSHGIAGSGTRRIISHGEIGLFLYHQPKSGWFYVSVGVKHGWLRTEEIGSVGSVT